MARHPVLRSRRWPMCPPRRTLFPLLFSTLLHVPAGADETRPHAAVTAPAPSLAALPAFIDARIDAKLAEQGLKPSPPADDAEFLRRAALDITGRIPSADETATFLADRRKDKRERKIDELLDSPARAEHLSEVWSVLLSGRARRGQDRYAQKNLQDWLRGQFEKNAPYDAMVRDLIAAKGRTDENPAVFYLLRFREAPFDAVGHVSRVFTGVQIQCAQCHNHPYEKWTQEDFFGMAAFLTRTKGRVVVKPDQNKGIPVVELFDAPRGEVSIPDSKPPKVVPPKFLGGETPAPKTNRRDELAQILTAPSNPWFARAIVNRVWYQCFGRGLVEPVDDFKAADPGTHPELLEGLAAAFVAGGHDLRALQRGILMSKAWQRSSRTTPENASDSAYYSHALLRAMSPEQLFDSILKATGAGEGKILGPELTEAVRQRILQQFSFTFANDEMQEVLDFEGTIPQALLMCNGGYTNGVAGRRPAAMAPRGRPGRGADALRAPAGRPTLPLVESLIQSRSGPDERVEQIFLHVLSRRPTDEERSRYLAHVRKNGDLRQSYEDIAWTLLNTTEFLYIH